MAKERKTITWGNQDQANAEQIAALCKDDMISRDIPTHTSKRVGGEEDINYTGIIRYALQRLAEIERRGES